MATKIAADIDAVKAAYAKIQEDASEYRKPHVVNLLDLAVVIAGRSFPYSGAADRRSQARQSVNWPQLERSVTELAENGWLIRMESADARALNVQTYGMAANGKYWLSQTDRQTASARQETHRRNQHRARLMTQAKEQVLALHDGEVQSMYGQLLADNSLATEG